MRAHASLRLIVSLVLKPWEIGPQHLRSGQYTSLGAGEVRVCRRCAIVFAVPGMARRCVCMLQGKCRGWCEVGDVSGVTECLEAPFCLFFFVDGATQTSQSSMSLMLGVFHPESPRPNQLNQAQPGYQSLSSPAWQSQTAFRSSSLANSQSPGIARQLFSPAITVNRSINQFL